MQINDKRPAQFIAPAVILLSFFTLIYTAKTSAFPFFLSLAAAYLINPIIEFFHVRGIKRIYAVAGLYLVAGAIATMLIMYLVSLASQELSLLQTEWPVYYKKIQAVLLNAQGKLAVKYPYLENYYAAWGGHLGSKAAYIIEGIPAFILSLAPALSLLILVPFITFFLLLEGANIQNYVLDLLPSRHVELALHIISEVDGSLGNYLRGILTEAFCLFLLALGGLLLMKLDYAAAIAVVVGITSLIPYLGAIVGGILAVTAAFIQYYSVWPMIKVLIFFAGLRFLDDWLLQPLIMKKAVELHPAIILFALLCGGELFGIWGLIFAIPAACVIKVFLTIILELHRSEFGWRPKSESIKVSIPYT